MATPDTFSEVTGEKLLDLRKTAYQTATFKYLNNLDYTDFFRDHLVPNCPCVFSPELTKEWKSRQAWVTDDGSPNFELLKSLFGEAVVPVANCKQEQYSSHPKQDWRLGDYLAYWRGYREKGHPTDWECLYLKDWHFTKAFPTYQAYKTPVFFQSDWLNEYWDTLPQDDYRFVYMGPKGTWTPFHTDVYRSFSWSANICGRKRWIFYPPGCEECLKDRHGNLVYDVTSPELDDPGRYPRATEVRHKVIEVIQEWGEVIFVPSGWHHQVINLEDTISINHNWLNGSNIDICWRHLVDSLEEVKAEIADCRDMEGWHEQCQLILKASAGIDFQMFIDLLEVIAGHRVTTWQQEGYSLAPESQHSGGGGDTDNSNTPATTDTHVELSRSEIKCSLEADNRNTTLSMGNHTTPCTDSSRSDIKCSLEADLISPPITTDNSIKPFTNLSRSDIKCSLETDNRNTHQTMGNHTTPCTDSSRSDIKLLAESQNSVSHREITCSGSQQKKYSQEIDDSESDHVTSLSLAACSDCTNSDIKCGDFELTDSNNVVSGSLKDNQVVGTHSVSDKVPLGCDIEEGLETLYICDDTDTKLLKDGMDTDQSCKCDTNTTLLRISRDSRSNVELTSRDFVFYDLMRIQEVLTRILGNPDLEQLSPDYLVKVRQTLELIKTCCGDFCF